MDREAAVEKIKKLLAMANHANTSPGEIATSAFLAQRLIEKFNIDAVLLSEQSQTVGENPSFVIERVYTFKGPRVLTWALNLVGALGHANSSKTWYYSGRGSSPGYLEGCGRECDLSTIRYMMAYLCNEVERLCESASKAQRMQFGKASKSWTHSFKLGCVTEISIRLREAAEKTREEMLDPSLAYTRAIACGDTQRIIELDNAPKYEIAVIQKALATLDDRKKQAKQWAEDNLGKFHSGPSRTSSKSYSAFSAGREAGRTVNLNGNNKRLS